VIDFRTVQPPINADLIFVNDVPPAPGPLGILIAMFQQAQRDAVRGEWYEQLEAAEWAINTYPALLAQVTGDDEPYLRNLVRHSLPVEVVAVVSHLTPLQVNALGRMVKTDGTDALAAIVLKDYQP
jgi:hypothetical protein